MLSIAQPEADSGGRLLLTRSWPHRRTRFAHDRRLTDKLPRHLVPGRLSRQARVTLDCRALTDELLDVRRTVAVVPVPRVVSAVPLVRPLRVSVLATRPDVELFPRPLEVVAGEAVRDPRLDGLDDPHRAELVRSDDVTEALLDDDVSLA